jgi:streptomycin 6-kinase
VILEPNRSALTVPPGLAEKVGQAWADDGRRWLARLPLLLEQVCTDWDLVLGRPFELTLHWVSPVTRADGSPAVLKLGVPDGHLVPEAEALRILDGDGAVQLLAEDLGRGALLLERAAPGTPVAELVPGDDAAATAALIEVGRRLHRPVPPGCRLPELRTQGAALRAHLRRFPGDDPLPRRLVEAASRLFDELCAGAPEPVILHGDLHHHNAVRAEREPWLSIDPHGLVGDPGYDCGAMIYNPDPERREGGLLALVPARIEQLAAGFGLPVERIVAWGFTKAMLSEVWDAAAWDGQGSAPTGGRALDVAEMLWQRLP